MKTTLIFTGLIFALITTGCVSTSELYPAVDPPTVSSCSFISGVDLAIAGHPYDNSCTENEDSVLTGYAVGRKLRLARERWAAQTKTSKCLKKEYDFKFSGSISPIYLGLNSSPEDSVSKKLDREGCSASGALTSFGLRSDITESEKNEKPLENKVVALSSLRNKASEKPNEASGLIADYKKTQPQDPLDVDFRWKPYIEAKGGVDNLTDDERTLLANEVYRPKELNGEIVTGALLGFGIGHHRQGRYDTRSWLYTALDSVLLGTIIYGVSQKDSAIALIPLVFGLPLSRFAQVYDVWTYNRDHSFNWQDLRTENENRGFAPRLQLAFTF